MWKRYKHQEAKILELNSSAHPCRQARLWKKFQSEPSIEFVKAIIIHFHDSSLAYNQYLDKRQADKDLLKTQQTIPKLLIIKFQKNIGADLHQMQIVINFFKIISTSLYPSIKVVEQLVKRTCKCHGVSGSCSVKTCWNQLAVFSETAAVIKSKYDNAVQVNVEIRENSSHLKTESSTSSKNQESNRILPQSRAKKGADQVDEASAAAALARNGGSGSVNAADRVDRKEMIYQQKSPDFCVANPLGPGTVDRQCLRGENCDILCCGRGYNVHRLTVSAPCKCKLVLCCQVECQTCLVEKTIHTCK